MTSIEWLVNVVQCNIAPNYIPKEIVEKAKEMYEQEISKYENNASFDNQIADVSKMVEDDVEKLAEEMYGKGKVPDYEEGFIDGYNKAKETLYTDLISWIDNEILLNPYYKDSARLKEGVTIVKNRLIIKNEVHKRTIS